MSVSIRVTLRFSFALLVILSCASSATAAAQNQLAKWEVPILFPNRDLGGDVVVSQGRILTGCQDLSGVPVDKGSVCIFNAVGTALAEIQASEQPAFSFGEAIAVHGDRVVIGEPGRDSVYVFDLMTGQELFELAPMSLVSGSRFGASIATDGTLVIVGAPDDNQLGVAAGRAYVFDLASGAEMFELAASNSVPSSDFGFDVAIAGDRAVVSAPLHGGANKGNVYVFDVATGNQLLRLIPDEHAASDRLGFSIAMDTEIVVVGSPGKSLADSNESVLLFDLQTGGQLAEILAPEESNFGESVALHGDRIVVGAPDAPNSNGLGGSGAAYLYQLSTGSLVTALGFGVGSSFFNNYGQVVSIDDALITVFDPGESGENGLQGAVHVYDSTTGQSLGSFGGPQGGYRNFFGSSVAIEGNRALIGAPGNDDGGDGLGSAYFFDVAAGEAVEQVSGSSDGLGGPIDFGAEVALSGEVAWVAAPKFGVSQGRVDQYEADTGAAVFPFIGSQSFTHFGDEIALGETLGVAGNREPMVELGGALGAIASVYDLDSGALVSTFRPSVPVEDRPRSLAIGGPWAAMGLFDLVTPKGESAVYLFEPTTGVELYRMTGPSDEVRFGYSVALNATRLAVGAPYDDTAGVDAGAVYVFDPTTGRELYVLTSSDQDPFALFGLSLAIEDGLLLVGALDTFGVGAVYGFDLSNGAELFRFIAADGGNVGHPIAVSGNRALFGSPREAGSSFDAGAVYLVDVPILQVPLAYCDPKSSSLGCLASIGSSSSSAPFSGADGWSITASGVDGFKAGLLISGIAGPAALPFSGGTLCVAPPIKRGPTTFSAGTAGACDGSFQQVINNGQGFPQGFDPGSGNTAWYQWWLRDPQNPQGGIALSNALQVSFL